MLTTMTLRAVPVRVWVGLAFAAVMVLSVWRFGSARYDAGYADRDRAYQAALDKKNDEIRSLNAQAAAQEEAAADETARAVAEAKAHAGPPGCSVLPPEQLNRLNRIR